MWDLTRSKSREELQQIVEAPLKLRINPKFTRSYMLYGMTSDPSERPDPSIRKLTREAHAIDNLLFMAWATQNSENHDVIVYTPQASNYRLVHGMNLRKAKRSAKIFAQEKVEVLQKLAEENGLEANVFDTSDEMDSIEFQTIYENLLALSETDLEIRNGFIDLVPPWMRRKINNDPTKIFQLAEYGIREVAYILLRANQTKIGHNAERTYDNLAARLVEDKLVKSQFVPSFHYPYQSGKRLASDRPIEPYRVPNNPGARADRILICDTPEKVKEKIDKAIDTGNWQSAKAYLEMISETANMINPRRGTMMDWLPKIAQGYLAEMDEQDQKPITLAFPTKKLSRIAMASAASLAIATGSWLYLTSNKDDIDQRLVEAGQKRVVRLLDNGWKTRYSAPIVTYVAGNKTTDQLTLEDVYRIEGLWMMDSNGLEYRMMAENHPDKLADYEAMCVFRSSRQG